MGGLKSLKSQYSPLNSRDRLKFFESPAPKILEHGFKDLTRVLVVIYQSPLHKYLTSNSNTFQAESFVAEQFLTKYVDGKFVTELYEVVG